ncbi:MAG: hypothetical protein PUF50_01635 [Erysipelotrichaceae bacterium]|nr:hypothetical protein [Erysipelotrichaceae bacterium]
MKRLLLDILLILMIVSIGAVISTDLNEPTIPLEQQLQDYEKLIENGVIYQPNRPVYLLQTEENNAGKLGNVMSSFIVRVVQEGMGFLKEIWISFT